jgi:hypothetical protein
MGYDYEVKGHSTDPKRQYCAPRGVTRSKLIGKVNPSDWKHCSDAVGLALYAFDQGARS